MCLSSYPVNKYSHPLGLSHFLKQCIKSAIVSNNETNLYKVYNYINYSNCTVQGSWVLKSHNWSRRGHIPVSDVTVLQSIHTSESVKSNCFFEEK